MCWHISEYSIVFDLYWTGGDGQHSNGRVPPQQTGKLHQHYSGGRRARGGWKWGWYQESDCKCKSPTRLALTSLWDSYNTHRLSKNIPAVHSFCRHLLVCVFVLPSLNVFYGFLFKGPADGHFYRCVPALHAKHFGCDFVSTPHMDSGHSRHHGDPCYCLHVLFLCEFFHIV